MNNYSVLGKSITPRHAAEKATGRALYAGDIRLHDMLVGKFCRSPLPHARIVNLDTSLAEKLPGVKAVITSKDAPAKRIGRWVYDRPILADGKVRHIGEPVAAVAAVDEDTAEEAVSLIRVDYEDLPVVCDVREAMREGATIIHEDLASYQSGPGPRNSQGNVLHQVHLVTGDVDRALSTADVVHEESYTTPPSHQGFIQPHQAIAALSPTGKITLWDSTKAPFVIRKVVAETLGLPLTGVRVIAARVGGDFGGKGTANIEPACVLLALKSGCPVKMVLDYGEELTATFIRTRSYIDLATGATRDGLLTALRARVIFDIGAYNDAFTGYATTYNLVHGPYSIPNIDIDARVVYTNNTPTGHYRAPRAPQQTFAVESHLDGMARRLGIGPLDFRMRNVIKTGHRLAYGGVMGKVGVERTLQAARDFFSQNDAGKIEGEGWGVACAWWDIGAHGGQGPPSSAWVKLNEDGTATLFTGCAEQGGGQHDIMVQIVAEVLTISPESVALVTSDTDAAPFERGTGGSQTTYRAGMSVKLAAEDARRQLIAFAAQKLKVGPEKLETGNGRIFLSGSPEVFVTIASLCAEALTSARGPIMGIGEDLREERVAQSSEEKGLIDGAQTGTHVVKVAVDRETGKIKILKYFASHDAGFVLNRKNVEGQIDGGIVQAAGYALHEELLTENCRTLNPSLKDFRLIRAGDAPAGVEKSIVEVPSEHGPFGARGIGEPPHIPVAAAIANAIYDAVGVRIRDLPLSSSKIVKALKERQ